MLAFSIPFSSLQGKQSGHLGIETFGLIIGQLSGFSQLLLGFFGHQSSAHPVLLKRFSLHLSNDNNS
jgi:hypothetical protein